MSRLRCLSNDGTSWNQLKMLCDHVVHGWQTNQQPWCFSSHSGFSFLLWSSGSGQVLGLEPVSYDLQPRCQVPHNPPQPAKPAVFLTVTKIFSFDLSLSYFKTVALCFTSSKKKKPPSPSEKLRRCPAVTQGGLQLLPCHRHYSISLQTVCLASLCLGRL